MDDVKKKFPNHKIGIESKYGKIVYREAYDFKKAHKKFKETGELPPHLKKLVKDLDKVKVKHKVKNIVVPGLEWMSKIKESLEEAERDYKDEYKKFQSSTKAKKYRAELNKYNRQKGTYGNGDGKDASHKGGKIVGFESQSKNRGRAEKSRLKKEDIRQEIEEYVDGILDSMGEEFMVNEEKECMCEACQKGYMTHPTRKTKVMFGKRYRNCIKAEGNVNEESKVIKQISNLAKKNKYGTVDGTRMNAKTANLIMKIYNHPKMKNYKKKLDTYKSHELVDMTINMAKILKIKESKDNWTVNIKLKEGSCGYGIDGKLGEEPAGPHLMKKKKKKKDEVSLGGRLAKKVGKHKGSRNILSKADGIKKVDKMKKTSGAKIYKVDKVKTRLGGELITMYNLYTKNTNHSSMSNPYGLEMMRKGNKAAYLIPVKESVNEAGMELKKLEDAIKMFQNKIKKQGRVTNARDEDHLKNLIKIYKQMGGKKIKEAVKLKGKSGMGTISHVGMPPASKGVEKLFKIADTGFGKVGGQTVDSMSANLFKQIYNKANDDIKKKLNTKSEKQLIMILAKMWDKFGKNVKIGSSL